MVPAVAGWTDNKTTRDTIRRSTFHMVPVFFESKVVFPGDAVLTRRTVGSEDSPLLEKAGLIES